ncbi:MAG: U32 family peptidase, partial [Bacillota bacterium]
VRKNMTDNKKLELLAPGGNMQKAKTAFHFGADAVYVGGKAFSLRAFADNFSNEELEELIKYAHEMGKKVYVTLNIFAKNEDFDKIADFLRFLDTVNVDGVLVSDPGIVMMYNELKIKTPLHLSTQANTLNKYSAKFWESQNVGRIVVARELSLAEVKDIADNTSCEIETFVHGAMCISYSGRCLLSNYLTPRDANRGACVQACRWEYQITEASREGEPLTMTEDERGTYILNSKDLNLIRHIKDVAEAGSVSFKIEGRMKSEYYVATVVKSYREAMDAYLEGRELSEEIVENLDKAGHRNYTTCYNIEKLDNTQNYESSKPIQSYDFIGQVEKYENGYAHFVMRNRFKVGDTLEILASGDSFNKEFEVVEIKSESGDQIEDAKWVQQELVVKCPWEVERFDIIRKKKNA